MRPTWYKSRDIDKVSKMAISSTDDQGTASVHVCKVSCGWSMTD